jgi:2-aminoadipate transaminase
MDSLTDAALFNKARRMALLESSSEVTEILKLAERPDVLSLAGGLPDPRIFPLDRILDSQARVLRDEGTLALNYGPNAGFTRLREWIAERMSTHERVEAEVENVLVTSGGIEALNLVSMALLDPGDTVLVEAPTYLAALHVFRSQEARMVPVDTDTRGLLPDSLRERVKELAKAGVRPRFLYVIPSFQNPSGATWSHARRQEVVEICAQASLPIVEDHAYAELCYEGEREPSLKSLDPANVVFLHTFSKIFAPGVRLGWAVADRSLIEMLGLAKLGTDQCANTLSQRLVHDYGSRGYIDDQVKASIDLYRRKRDRMEAALARHLPSGTAWVHPLGGFFIWVDLRALAGDIDTEKLLPLAIEREKTAFVAGPPFFPERAQGKRFLRLSFSFIPEDRIEEAIERLGRAIQALAAPESSP